MKGYKPSVISKKDHERLKAKLYDPENNLQGYKELQRWYNTISERKIAYTTLVGYCIRHFGTKIKVARKSHVKKDEKAVETFK